MKKENKNSDVNIKVLWHLIQFDPTVQFADYIDLNFDQQLHVIWNQFSNYCENKKHKRIKDTLVLGNMSHIQ